MDTIFARSTAAGRAGVAVVRVSGPRAWDVVADFTKRDLPAPRTLTLRKIWCGADLVDLALVVVFEEGRSFTGELSAEFHLHGSEAVVRRLLSELGRVEDVRPAQAGEFTHRALENDCLDLTGVEALSALLQAETEAQRRQAIRVLDGALRNKAEDWRRDLLFLLSSIEVTVDFADEEVPEDVSVDIVNRLIGMATDMRDHASGVSASEKVARGFEVALVGAPNAGKSTLLNKLAGREAALTSEIAGTTRDIVEVRMEVAGHLVTLLDTAGIREATGDIEAAGIQRARVRSSNADLRLFIDGVPETIERHAHDIMIRGKADLDPGPGEGMLVSGVTGQGIDTLLARIGTVLSDQVSDAGLVVTERQAYALRRASDALDEAAAVLGSTPDRVEIVSDLVASAIRATDEIVGRIGVEDVLGEIFSTFCIGK